MKKVISITVEEEVIDQFKKENPNVSFAVSALIENALKPKAYDPSEQKSFDRIIKVASEFGVSNDESRSLLANRNLKTVPCWNDFKSQFHPNFDFWKYQEIRKILRNQYNKVKN